jgi:signal transduction histidine kinase
MTTKTVTHSASPPASQGIYGPSLAGTWQKIGLAAWAVIWLACMLVFVLSTRLWYIWDSTPIALTAQSDPALPPEAIDFMMEYQAAVRNMGLSLPTYGALFAGLRTVAAIPFLALSLLIIRRRNDRMMAVVFAIILAVIGAAGRWISPNWIPLPDEYPWTSSLIVILNMIINSSILLAFTLPDGRFVPRWTRWMALLVLLFAFSGTVLEETPLNLFRYLPGDWALIPYRFFMLVGLFAFAYRYRKVASIVQKQQLKWILAGTLFLSLFYFTHFLLYQSPLFAGWTQTWTAGDILVSQMILEPGWYIGQVLFAVSVGLAVFRYRLWEIDTIINRVLVFGSLTLLTMATYLAVVAALGSLFRSFASPAIFFLATGLVAIVFEPLRQQLQRLVNRLMYGERDDPYAVLTRLSNMLERSSVPADILPAVAATLGQALKLPYAAIWIHENGVERSAAVYGTAQPEFITFPLVYQSEMVGSMRVALRARGEQFRTADLRLIENIARQAGAAVQAVRLNDALVRSRAEIVGAREEERRRLRRDLHDGLGPILASQTLKMAAVRQLVRQNPARAEMLVDDVIRQNENTITEVRRLVYGLRPPALDEFGLVEAVRDLVRGGVLESAAEEHINITVTGPEEGISELPAAVEVNAYRITLEALTNAVRHAHARHCSIQFFRQMRSSAAEEVPVLVVEIHDDGTGMPAQYQAGVGIRSMRERAEELGGELAIRSDRPGGTRITAWLPLSLRKEI